MTIVGFIPGPSCVVATTPDDRPTRWCYQCRRHLPHTWRMLDDPPERQPSYYEPTPVLVCTGCGEDHTNFPGTYYDGPHYPESTELWKELARQAAEIRSGWDWDAIWKRFRQEQP